MEVTTHNGIRVSTEPFPAGLQMSRRWDAIVKAVEVSDILGLRENERIIGISIDPENGLTFLLGTK